MSRFQNGTDMDLPSTAGSIRRARERAEAGLPREDFSTFVQRQGMDQPSVAQQSIPRRPPPPPGPSNAGQSRIPRLQAPPGLQTKDGQIAIPISRPAPVAQWPLAGPLTSPANSSDSEPYRPPPGRSQPPQRPPRPSRVPSILDGSRIQDPTPSFQYTPQNVRDSDGNLSTVPETPSSVSRPSTLSSLASIPDFPLPMQMPPPPPVAVPRRSVNLGPPPSARRGASSFYSNASFVSPIPEESPRSRSHASFASSAAMPESWGTPSPGPSPQYPEAYLDDSTVDESAQSPYDEGDESRLVRSASIGKRAKASLVTTSSKALDADDMPQRPGPSPMRTGLFNEGTGYLDASSSSTSTVPTTRTAGEAALTADAILSAYDAATASDPSNPSRRMSVSPQPAGGRSYSRLSAIRRPPKLDIDAVRKAESRGSLTSLPDLIRRATRLAASLERGKRPASRFEDLNDFPGAYDGGRDGEKEYSSQFQSSKGNDLSLTQSADEYEKHQSGLSDMLAAFPPPAQPSNQRRSFFRQSLRDQVGSWPLPAAFNRSQSSLPNSQVERRAGIAQEPKKQGRRCCGLPLWGFLLIVLVILIIVAAAVVIPLEFFVIRKQNAGKDAQSALQQCQNQLVCANGGTNVVNQGICSCICTNGFTGFDCTVAGADGCTTANLAGETNINNVTLGNAIPRLVSQASNFSISLSGTQILAKFNAGNLSCGAENALVTFDGQSTRQGAANAVVTDPTTNNAVNGDNIVNGVAIVTVMVMAGQSTTVTVDVPTYYSSGAALQTANGAGTFSTIFGTTISYPAETSTPPTTTTTVTTTITPSTSSATSTPTDSFTVTEETLDFARVVVLFVLQEETLTNAESAQNALQRFFSSASDSYLGTGSSVTTDQARNVSIGNGNTIDFVDLAVDIGQGVVGGSQSTRHRFRDRRLVPFRE